MFDPSQPPHVYDGTWFWDELILGEEVMFHQRRHEISWRIGKGGWTNRTSVTRYVWTRRGWRKETKGEQMKRIRAKVWKSVRKYTPPETFEFIGEIGNPPETQP